MASFAVAAYQDVKDRAVSDLVWIPAIAGTVYSFYWYFTIATFQSFEFQLIKLALIGGIGVAFVFFGLLGEADAIAMAFIASDPYPLSPIPALIAGGAIAITHIVYEYANGNAKGGRRIPMEQFLREQRWIPKAIISDGNRVEISSDVNDAREEVESKKSSGGEVEVAYGVPTVAYLGLGYAAFIAYLLIFASGTFSFLP